MKNLAVLLILCLVSSCGIFKKHKEASKRDSVSFAKEEFRFKQLDSLRSILVNVNYQRTVSEFEPFRDSSGKIIPVLKRTTQEQLNLASQDSQQTKSTEKVASNNKGTAVQESNTETDSQNDTTVNSNFPWLSVTLSLLVIAAFVYFFIWRK